MTVEKKSKGLEVPQETCRYGVRDGIARCRNQVPCPEPTHREGGGAPLAPRPDVILTHINVNEDWFQLFEAAGVVARERTKERGEELRREHEVRAERLGRDPYKIREDLGWETNLPESADSGVLALRVLNGEISKVFPELEGFFLTGYHMLIRSWKKTRRITLEFTSLGYLEKGPEHDKKRPVPNFPWKLFMEFALRMTFGRVEVWANERWQGKVVHSFECYDRRDGIAPTYSVLYKNGDWGWEPWVPRS